MGVAVALELAHDREEQGRPAGPDRRVPAPEEFIAVRAVRHPRELRAQVVDLHGEAVVFQSVEHGSFSFPSQKIAVAERLAAARALADGDGVESRDGGIERVVQGLRPVRGDGLGAQLRAQDAAHGRTVAVRVPAAEHGGGDALLVVVAGEEEHRGAQGGVVVRVHGIVVLERLPEAVQQLLGRGGGAGDGHRLADVLRQAAVARDSAQGPPPRRCAPLSRSQKAAEIIAAQNIAP